MMISVLFVRERLLLVVLCLFPSLVLVTEYFLLNLFLLIRKKDFLLLLCLLFLAFSRDRAMVDFTSMGSDEGLKPATKDGVYAV